MQVNLIPHQKAVLDATKEFNRVAYYLDMGLGKTFVGAEKMAQLGNNTNLIVCQKSKVDDWEWHMLDYYSDRYVIFNLTEKGKIGKFLECPHLKVGIINYDVLYRRDVLQTLKGFTLMLDESSVIKNDRAKRTKAVMKLKADNVILLSGTPTGGKYEELWSQCRLLGWNIGKTMFLNTYTKYTMVDYGQGFKQRLIYGYKNVDRLKNKLHEHGAVFMKTDEVITLPEQNFFTVSVPRNSDYDEFVNERAVMLHRSDGELVPDADGDYMRVKWLVGDTTLTKMLYMRQLCGQYSKEKLQAFEDLIASSDDRFVVFYNFTDELNEMLKRIGNRKYSVVNGQTKDLKAYEGDCNSITFVQYQAGAMGLNLQKANRIIYFTLPLSSELYEQSKKRIHRVGQQRPCFYYTLLTEWSIEEKIKKTLERRQDFTEKLFEKEYEND